MPDNEKVNVVWHPQSGPQQALVECPLPLVGYGGARGGGKGLLRTQKVHTPYGLKAIGDLRLGDVLCAIDGGTTKVVGIYERGVQPCYRITFSDGKEVICDADHRWRLRIPGTAQARLEKYGPELQTGRRIPPGIWTTEKLAQRITKANYRPQLPVVDPIALEPIYSSLPIEPYTLGLLLGDGCISNGGIKRHFSFGTADEQLRDFFISAGWNCRKASPGPLSKRTFWDLRAHGQVAIDLASGLTKLGLQGTNSYTKFIPEAYLMAPIKDRFAILQGLMDTDGSISLCGSAQFDSVNKRLIDGVRALVESLGGYCNLKTYKQKVRANSAGKRLQPLIYRLAIRLGDNSGLFRLRRKLIRCRRAAKQAVRCIVNIDEAEAQETVCIKVDHHTSMFLLEGCIPTMNTDGVLGKFGILAEMLGDTFNGVFFRKELPQADDLIERAKQIYLPLDAHYNDQKKQFTFKAGGRLRFRPLANNADAEKYQGQNLCVAVGTLIRMADGTFKPIESIQIGEYVATLIGPRKVTNKVTPYLAPCVENRVWDQDGNVVGVQQSPIWHPVLTAHGVFSSVGYSEQHKSQIRHIDEQSRQWALSVCNADRKFPAYKGLRHQAWFACLEDGKTYCKESLDGNLTLQQLPSLSVPVTLHAPTVRLKQKRERSCHDVSTECCAQGKSDEQLSGLALIQQKIWQDFERPGAPFQPIPYSPLQPDGDLSCEQTNLRTALGFQIDYLSYRDLCDAHSRLEPRIARGEFPLQGGAVESYRTLTEDASGTTQTHSPVPTQWWVHPYSGKAFHLTEDVVFGKMVSSYIGEQWVTDLTVEEANHYISDCGVINKNSHAAVEEAGNYPNPEPIFKLYGALRGGTAPQLILTFNPGGPGHHWLKEKFIRPAPKGWKILKWQLGSGNSIDYIYIPSRVQDNKILLDKDPGYIDRLHMVGSPELVRAWLEGDFEIHEGSYFPEFSGKHIIAPFTIPKHWPRYLGYDWGYRSPFAAVWGAVCSGKNDEGAEMTLPRGAMVIYREMWGKQIENRDQAERIASVSVGENLHAVADPSIFATDGGPSINDQFNTVFAKYKHPAFRRADNDRISGWSQIRRRLQHDPPMLYIFSTCPYLIESLPALQIDPTNHEDADTNGDDHCADAIRYLLKERLLESNYEKPLERTIERGRVKLQLFINQVRAQQKQAKL